MQEAAETLAGDERVMAVYAFGSRARGRAGPRSDYDLAVLLDGPLDLREELRLRGKVVRTLKTDAVDLVLLNQAPPPLRYEIVSTGERLFARHELAVDRFEERTAMEYFDTAHFRTTQRELVRESLG